MSAEATAMDLSTTSSTTTTTVIRPSTIKDLAHIIDTTTKTIGFNLSTTDTLTTAQTDEFSSTTRRPFMGYGFPFDLSSFSVPIAITVVVCLALCLLVFYTKARRRRQRMQSGPQNNLAAISGGVPMNVNAYRNYGLMLSVGQSPAPGSTPSMLADEPPPYEIAINVPPSGGYAAPLQPYHHHIVAPPPYVEHMDYYVPHSETISIVSTDVETPRDNTSTNLHHLHTPSSISTLSPPLHPPSNQPSTIPLQTNNNNLNIRDSPKRKAKDTDNRNTNISGDIDSTNAMESVPKGDSSGDTLTETSFSNGSDVADSSVLSTSVLSSDRSDVEAGVEEEEVGISNAPGANNAAN